MPSSIHSKDKQTFKNDLVESQKTSRPSSAKEAVETTPHDEEKGIEPVQATEEPFDARSTKTTESLLPPPPDGGLHAWLKVFGGFMIYVRFSAHSPIANLSTNVPQINIWGFTLSYGAFQAYYKSDLLSSASPSAISWIGTVQAWLLIFFGVLSGPLFDLGYFRVMLVAGNFLVVFGIMMLSLSTQYWQVFLSQGICMGLGAGLLYIPSLALVGIWFDKKRAIALGIVMSGIAVGEFHVGISWMWVLMRCRWCCVHPDV